MQNSNCNPSFDASTTLRETFVISKEIQEQIDLFNLRFLSMINPEDKDTINIIPYVVMMIKKFPLVNLTAQEICHESYIRSYKKIIKGEVIKNYQGWLKKVSFNIIREENVKERKRIGLQERLIPNIPNYDSKISFNNTDKITQLYACIETLNAQEFQLLKLKIVEGMTYEEIGNSLVEQGEETMNDAKLQAKLRQQVKRAKAKLRRNFTVDS